MCLLLQYISFLYFLSFGCGACCFCIRINDNLNVHIGGKDIIEQSQSRVIYSHYFGLPCIVKCFLLPILLFCTFLNIHAGFLNCSITKLHITLLSLYSLLFSIAGINKSKTSVYFQFTYCPLSIQSAAFGSPINQVDIRPEYKKNTIERQD